MDVNEAVNRRSSIRAFLDDPVDDDTIAELLAGASRAPSGGNVQPWRIYVIGHETMPRFRSFIADRELEEAGYPIYPAKLWEPYRSNRFSVGEQMYGLLGIPRSDKDARLQRFAENYDFFGAPTALFCFIDRGMGPPQWSDLGMFLQTFMLLAIERGIDTCPQECWAHYSQAVAEFVGAPDDEMLFCGMAIGYRDPDAPVNQLRSDRMPLDQWAKFL